MPIAAALSLVVTAVSTVVQMRQAKKAQAAEREGRAINVADQKNKDKLARRQVAKAERVKRANIEQAAENTGATGSSGFIGAKSALSSNTASAFGGQRGGGKAASAISAANQRASDARSKASNAKAFGELLNTGIDTFDKLSKPRP